MTIKEYVLQFSPMGINNWINQIERDGFSKYQKEIIQCADAFNRIEIKHKASFKKAINL